EHVADLVVGRVDVAPERAWMALEDEDARLGPMAQIRAFEHVAIGQLVRPNRGGDVDDIDLRPLDDLLAGRADVTVIVSVAGVGHGWLSFWGSRRATAASNRKW